MSITDKDLRDADARTILAQWEKTAEHSLAPHLAFWLRHYIDGKPTKTIQALKARLQLAEDARDKLSQEYARVVARCYLAEDACRAAEASDEWHCRECDSYDQRPCSCDGWRIEEKLAAWRAGRGE